MNSSSQHVRVKDEGAKHIRLKGIDIPAGKPGVSTSGRVRSPSTAGEGLQRSTTDGGGVPARKKASGRKITGVRIEFRDEDERARFVALMKRVQGRLLPLPDL
jgi:hypothetical protein